MNGLVQHGDITHEISINWRTDSPGLIGQIHPPRDRFYGIRLGSTDL